MKSLRIIDANINRLREGLRVIEDILRYEFDAEDAIKEIKKNRHKISQIDKLTFSKRLFYRDSLNDCGFDNIGANEKNRSSLSDVIRANCLRIEESARVLEELLKLDNDTINASDIIKEIRYNIYDIEKLIFEKIIKKNIDLSLYLVTESKLSNYPLCKVIEQAIKGGVTSVQLREKELCNRDFYVLGKEVKQICSNFNVPLIINDRVDMCIALDADGVHLGEEDFPVIEARRILGNSKIIGLSVKKFEDIKEANKLPIDYIGFGAVFQTPTKEGYNEQGIEIIKDVIKESALPVVFIGGINTENAVIVRNAGGENIAVVSAIMGSPSPKDAALKLKKRG